MNRAALVFFPIVAVVALLLSLPRFLEGMLALTGDAAIEILQAGPVVQDAVNTLVKSREHTLDIIDRGRSHSELASALELRSQTQTVDEWKATLDRAVHEAERGVAQAPADAIAWFHLAKALFARDGANQRAVDAALSSIAVGPYETDLLVPRLDILFASRSYLSQQYDEIIDNQVRVTWKRYDTHFDLVRIIRWRVASDIARRGLEREPSIAQGFDETIADPNFH